VPLSIIEEQLMKEVLTFKRRKKGETDTDFLSLKKQATARLHELCGNLWTDFNAHDPGVTILEQLCYVLTDIEYRAGFDTADYLTDETGNIDTEGLALYAPSEVLPCRATTMEDYRRVLLDRIEEIDNVWIAKMPATGIEGLYQITLLLNSAVEEKLRPRIVEAAAEVYRGARNLCEDLGEIRLVEEIFCVPAAKVDVASNRPPAALLAEIYSRLAAWLCPFVTRIRWEDDAAETYDFTEPWNGPAVRHRKIIEPPDGAPQGDIQLSEAAALIGRIDGVGAVFDISIEDLNGRFPALLSNEQKNTVFRLLVPRKDDEIKIKLFRNARPIPVEYKDLAPELEKYARCSEKPLSENKQFPISDTPPLGTHRDIRLLGSIQNLFPGTYGIGSLGLPLSTPLDRKAKAAQLKGYLLLFEQMTANHMASINSIKDLFSIRSETPKTYFSQALDESVVPDAKRLWRRGAPLDTAKRIAGQYDDYHDRKGRVLDYLLALHGERFSQKSLRHLSFYETHGEVDDAVLENKQRLLSQIFRANRDRSAGYDLCREKTDVEKISGLRRKASLLLGIETIEPWLTDALRQRHIRLISDERFAAAQRGQEAFAPVEISAEDEGENVPRRSLRRSSIGELQKAAPAFTFPRLLGRGMLREGVFLDRYRLLPDFEKGNCRLLLKTCVAEEEKEEKQNELKKEMFWQVGTFDNAEEAAVFANALRSTFLLLNKKSEGFHTVEHILLRPLSAETHDEAPSDFYSFTLSIIVPSWTARFHDRRFFQLLKETVSGTCPAHLRPRFFRFDFDEMTAFEDAWKHRLAHESDPHASPKFLDTLSAKVKRFLLNRPYEEDIECS
jgi:hypothetical protein